MVGGIHQQVYENQNIVKLTKIKFEKENLLTKITKREVFFHYILITTNEIFSLLYESKLSKIDEFIKVLQEMFQTFP